MPLPELSDEEAATLVAYVRKKFDAERWPYSVELRPIRERVEKADGEAGAANPAEGLCGTEGDGKAAARLQYMLPPVGLSNYRDDLTNCYSQPL